jgi:pimeloyl-ACP methyl ester carboxylesterase
MQTIAQDGPFASDNAQAGSAGALWTGRGLSALAVLFLVFDSIGKLLEVQPVVDGATRLGYPSGLVFRIGVLLLLCVVAYVIPRTSVLGAVLLTGYLGGAVATHVRVGSPLFSHILFPTYVAALVWSGLLLRDPRLRVLVALRGRRDQDVQAGHRGLAMSQVISRDGTSIAYDRSGSGPALILVDGALCSRSFGPSANLTPLLAPHFTVYKYDRRGRGQSGDMQPYATAREVEDIEVLIREAGEPVFLVGLSSGGALALEAAASGLAIRKVVAYEPPYVNDGGRAAGTDHERRLQELVDAGNRGGAVAYFMRSMVQVPAPFVVMMRLMPWIWRKLKAVAHTLPYDAAVMTEFKVPRARLRSIGIPVLAMHGSKTDPRLQRATRGVAEAIPGAAHRVLEGQTHNVKPGVLVPAVVEFFTA